jgi:hypothetical protein
MTWTKTAIIRQKKKTKFWMSTADTGHLFVKIWIAPKQSLPIANTFH